MHGVRWLLTAGWLLLIASLLFDPWTARLMEPAHPWSPLRLPDGCVAVQGRCLSEQPVPIGTTLFWGAVVPSSIFVLLVFGHELWRRICPLSFLSQIPRALGWQRQFEKVNPKTGKRRLELARVPADSWLGRHYGELQFGWLFAGLCGRLLFFNADRVVLAGWLLFTIAAAIAVGYWFGGKSWCQYFCPMAPVQAVYSTPAGLLGSQAHTSEQTITQSMCRTVLPDGSEQSACVACQQPCIDIDAERMYWAGIETPQAASMRYGYVGLVAGYFLYYYLYAGNWWYYFSGAWARHTDQLASLLSPGLYVFGTPVVIPKLVAVPLVLGLCTWLGRRAGRWIEGPANELRRHRVFCLSTFAVFNLFFVFGGRPLVLLLPVWAQYGWDLAVVMLSTLWLARAWRRSPDLYGRENLASRFRRQLEKLKLDVGQYLEGRSLADLNTHEVYVLAKVLPGFSREKRHEAYKGVVREALEEGYVNVSSSLEVLRQMREELGISTDEHLQLLDELGVEDPELLDPDRKRSLEDQIRLSGYRKSLERLLLLQSSAGSPEVAALQSRFRVSPQEEAILLGGLSPTAGAVQKLEMLLARLPELISQYRALHDPSLPDQPAVLALLRDQLRRRKELSVGAILDGLIQLQGDPRAMELTAELRRLSPRTLPALLDRPEWQRRLPSELADALRPESPVAAGPPAATPEPLPPEVLRQQLDTLAQDRNPTVRAASLYLLAQLDLPRARQRAASVGDRPDPLLRETAEKIRQAELPPPLTELPLLEKLVVLSASDFFHGTHSDTLATLAAAAELRRFDGGGVITEAGDTCRELLLLVEGEAAVHYQEEEGLRLAPLRPGQVLDELEVLTHGASENTVVAQRDGTRVLAVPVEAFDSMLDHDSGFARRVLELETAQLQRFMRTVQGQSPRL
jgi:CRP-like cAMP-binding protein